MNLFSSSKFPRREGYTYFLFDSGSDVHVMSSQPSSRFQVTFPTEESVCGISGSVKFKHVAPTVFGQMLVSPQVKVNLLSLHMLEQTHTITYKSGQNVIAVNTKTGMKLVSEKFGPFTYFVIDNSSLFRNAEYVGEPCKSIGCAVDGEMVSPKRW